MSKVKTKVSIKNFEEIIKKIESQGFDLKNLNTAQYFLKDGPLANNDF